MVAELPKQFSNLLVSSFFAWLIWWHYRLRTFDQTEKYSTFGPRFWTGFIDSCVLWPVGFVASILLSFNIPRGLAAMLVIVESLAWLLYTVVMHARHGQTVGKMVTKVRVVDFITESKISYRQAWLREGIPVILSLGILGYEIYLILTGALNPQNIANGQMFLNNHVLWLLTALPGLWFMAEILTMFTNTKRRALHDLIAGTVVIRTHLQEKAAPANAVSAAEPPLIMT